MSRLILGLISSLVLVGCATTRIDDGVAPSSDSITDFIMRWDTLDRQKASQDEYKRLYAQALKALSRSLEETDKLKAQLDSK